MNWILVFVFNLLLFNSCPAANVDRESSLGGVQVNTFNEDFSYAIYDIADFRQILQFAKKPETADFVKNIIFPLKYPDHYMFRYPGEFDGDEYITNDCIYIRSFSVFVDVITHFGKHLKKLSTYGARDLNDEQIATLNECINEHCSDSLNELYIGQLKENSFTHFKKPFPNVKKLGFEMKIDEIGSIGPFNETFPNLEYLNIDYMYSQINVPNNVIRLIESELPIMEHLEELNVVMGEYAEVVTIYKQLENMLQKNPQIRKLYIYNVVNDFIHKINEYLPNLEYLSVRSLNSENQPVHFENVKCFRVIEWSGELPAEKISFSRLDTLRMFYDNEMNETQRDSWTHFFRNHQHLKQLNCTVVGSNGFVDFIAEVPNLHEINIASGGWFNLDMASGLIEVPNKWVEFHYYATGQIADFDTDGFVEKYKNEWDITFNSPKTARIYLDMIRKN